MTASCPRSPWKGFLRLALLLLAGIVAGFLLLMASFLLPIDPMERNVLLSVPALDGSWGTGEEAYEQVLKGYETTQLDNSTDAYMLLSAIHRSDTSLIDRAINVYTYHHEINYRQFDSLLQYAQTGRDEDMKDTATARYWLGYLIVLKPLLLAFTYMDIRMLNMMAQGLLLAGILTLMIKRGLRSYALPFALSMVCITPAITGLSLQFSTALLVMLIAMLALLWKPSLVENRLGDAAFFMLTGMATSYFDFLTYPLVTFGMPFILWLLLHREESARQRWLRLLRCGAAWCAGYLGMWAGKWLLAFLYDGETFWWTVMGSVEKRTSAEIMEAGGVISRLDALRETASVFFKKPYLLLALATAAVYGVRLIRAGGVGRGKPSPSLCLALLAVAALPFLWFWLTANHAYSHAFYTSRTLAVTVFSGLCLLSALAARGSQRD